MTLLWVSLAGGLGAAARFWLDGAIRERWQPALPVATITVNVLGSLLIGVFTALALTGGLAEPWPAIAATGFCGGFTTFSGAMMESVRLIGGGDVRRGVTNAVLTMVLTLAAVLVGFALTGAVLPGP